MEEWRDIPGFEGYQISSCGNVRTFWQKKRKPTGYGCYRTLTDIPRIIPTSDDGNGYRKVMLRSIDGKEWCPKVHKLVAEAFIPKPDDDSVEWTVDHIESGPEGKLDNSVCNLRWISRADNIRKAYRDGMCDDRIRSQEKWLVCTDIWTDEEYYFSSNNHAAKCLGVDCSTISHALSKGNIVKKHYLLERVTGKDRLLYSDEYYANYAWGRN